MSVSGTTICWSYCEFIQLDMKDFQKIEPELNEFGAPDVVITDPSRPA